MRRFLILFLSVALLGLLPALAEETQGRAPDFAIRFEDGDLSAFVNSGTCTLTAAEGLAHSGDWALRVSGRTTNHWDAVDLKVGSTPIEAGKPFRISCWVYVDSDRQGEIAIGKAGGDYAYLTTLAVSGREWHQLVLETTLDSLLNLRVLTTSDSYLGATYYVDDIELVLDPDDDDTFSNYVSDFSAGTDGWYARSAGSATVEVTAEGALAIAGREASWNSPGHDFVFTPGKNYTFSVEVYQEEADSADFMISIAHAVGGVESYENLGEGTVKRGEWTTVRGSWTAGAFDTYVLYVETKNNGTLPFQIRNFKASRHVITFGAEDIPSLKEVYADAFDFGTAVTKAEADSAARMDFYATQFNILTPGNELKPDSVLDIPASMLAARNDDTAVAVHFTAATPLMDYALSHGIKLHGHVFVWHQQTPEAFFHVGYDVYAPYVSREVMLARLEHYMAAVFAYTEEHYPGVFVSWDVVNEAIDDSTGKLRDSNWLTVVGDDYIARAFELARKTAPEGTLLYYNDYNTAYQPKLGGIKALLESLAAEGNIDGYGFQMHHSISSPTAAQLRTAVDTIAATGLRLRVSELDVTVPDDSDESFRRQADYYAMVMDALSPYTDQLEAVQVWGVTDNLSWRASGYPLLFDGNAQPKYAFWALTDPSQIPPETKLATTFGPVAEENWEETAAILCEGFTIRSMYTDKKLLVQVDVMDETADDTDSVRIFADDKSLTIKRSNKAQATAIEGGYRVKFTIPLGKLTTGDTLGFDILVTDGDSVRGWNDQSDNVTDRYLGQLTLGRILPTVYAAHGSDPLVGEPIPVEMEGSADAHEGGTVSAVGYASWDDASLYVTVQVTDPYLDTSAAASYEQDSVEIFLDELNDRGAVYGRDDHHYRISCDGQITIDAGFDTVSAVAERTEDGYIATFVIPWTQAHSSTVGFDIRVNNAGADGRRRLLNFADDTDRGWSDPSLFGQLVLMP